MYSLGERKENHLILCFTYFYFTRYFNLKKVLLLYLKRLIHDIY